MIAKLKSSFLAPYFGLSYILKNPALIKYFIIPLLLSIIIYVITIIILIYNFKFILNKFLNILDFFTPSFFNANFMFILFKYILLFLIIIAVLYIFILLFTFLLNIIAAPFNEIITKKILLNFNINLNKNQLKLGSEILRIIMVELKKIILLSAISLSSIIISFIPIIAIFSFILNSFILGFYYIDYSLEVNLYSFKDRLTYIKNNFIYIACFGFSLSLILLVPVLNFIFILYSVAGAAILFKNLDFKN